MGSTLSEPQNQRENMEKITCKERIGGTLLHGVK